MDNKKILFIDLDGTLIKEDLSHLAFLNFIKYNPFKSLYHLFIFLFIGKAYLKEKISENFKVKLSKLTINKNCIEFILNNKNNYTQINLISGSHQKLLNQIQHQFDLFDNVYGTKNNYNMVGKNKIYFINKKLKIFKFDYVGNSLKDVPIWIYSEKIIYTNPSQRLIKKILNLKLDKIYIPELF